MKAFYASRISANLSETPEGFLICKNVPVSRTGMQEYLGQEIGLDEFYDQHIPVYRDTADVFERASLASFEGKPVCNEHPGEDVNNENSSVLVKGAAIHVRRGEGEDGDKVVADLVIYDKQLAQEILDGKRDISCGYTCEYEQVDDRVYQRRIRGNHIAVVATGRAGPEVSIKDSKPEAPMGKERSTTRMAKKPQKYHRNSKNGFLGRIASLMMDSEPNPEEVAEVLEVAAEIVQEATDNEAEDNETPADTAPPAADEEDSEGTVDSELLELVKGLAHDMSEMKDTIADMQAEKDTDPLDDMIDELEGDSESEDSGPEQWEASDEESADSEAVDEGAEDEETADEGTADEDAADEDPDEGTAPVGVSDKALAKHLRAMKPIIAKLPPAERKKATDSLTRYAKQARGKRPGRQKDGYARIMRGQQAAAQKNARDSKPKDPATIGRSIAAKRNPHYIEK